MTWPKVQQGRVSRTRNKILGQRRLPRGSVAKTWRLSDPSDPSSPSSGYTGDFVHGEQEGDGSFENARERPQGMGRHGRSLDQYPEISLMSEVFMDPLWETGFEITGSFFWICILPIWLELCVWPFLILYYGFLFHTVVASRQSDTFIVLQTSFNPLSPKEFCWCNDDSWSVSWPAAWNIWHGRNVARLDLHWSLGPREHVGCLGNASSSLVEM